MNDQQNPTPSTKITALDRLVGRWQVTGGAEGTVTNEWMPGKFFLRQDVELEQFGQKVVGIEIIGHLRPFMGEPSEDVHSRYYDDQGNTLDYVYEIEGDTLMIWAGEKGSEAYYKGTFSSDGNTLTRSWVYPGGGGYDTVQTRI